MMIFQITKKMDMPKMAPALRDLRGAPGYEDSIFLLVSAAESALAGTACGVQCSELQAQVWQNSNETLRPYKP